MKVDLRKIDRGIVSQEVKEYLDNLVDTLDSILINIDDENLTEEILNTIKGDN